MKLIAIAAIAAAGFAIPATASTLLHNGSFEDSPGVNGQNGNDFDTMAVSGGSWDIWTDIPGWTTTSGAGIEVQTDRTLGSIDAQDGDYYVELDSNNNSGMSQDVYLTTGVYELSFYYSPRTNWDGSNGIEYSVASISGDLASGSVDGPGGGTSVGDWTLVETTFAVAQDGIYVLSFDATGTSDSYGGLIDNVSLAPIPLPASGLLLLAAFGGMGYMTRRRKG